MAKSPLFLSLLFSLPVFSIEPQRLQLQPLDLKDAHPNGIHQLESNGRHIYIRSSRQSEVFVVDLAGELVHTLGGTGEHPAEFGKHGVVAMALWDRHLWGIDGSLKRVRLFHEGRYVTSFPLPNYNLYFGYPAGNAFAGNSEVVLVPAHPDTGFLAAAFHRDGTLLRHVGERPAATRALAETLPGIDDTFWLHDGTSWFAVHKYYPMVTVFNDQFEPILRFDVDSPVTRRLLERIEHFQPDAQNNLPMPVFTDVKHRNGKLYLMSWGRLHQLDAATGKLQAVYVFYGRGPEFAQVTAPFVTLFNFTLLNDRKLVLGHPAMPWDHDLWTAELP
ncbi:MAG: hypothetical protein QNK37_34810 [Acidobacteriota bacterium]|nr:hypothetical protein [Acidobacteriota bacterium]